MVISVILRSIRKITNLKVLFYVVYSYTSYLNILAEHQPFVIKGQRRFCPRAWPLLVVMIGDMT